MNRALLKENAKKSLQGKYGDAIALLGIMFAISFAIGLVVGFLNFDEKTGELISELVSLVLSCALGFGMTSYFLKISRNEPVTYTELFSKTNMFGSYLSISLLVGLFTFLWTLAFIIPGIIAALSYSMVYFVKLDNPDMGAMDVLRKSKQIMSGHKMDYFVLGLSFLGWAILGALTLGILYLWLIPYMQVTYANFYNSIKDENKAAL